MEICRDIVGFFPDEITKFSDDFYRNSRFRSHLLEKRLAEAIDALGHASGVAQGIPSAITTYSKLKACQHTLYVLKDAESNNKLIGILKVGRKKLFIMDLMAVQHEVEPLCLLDFYVHESKQRSGCGKQLFEAMLKSEGVKPHQLAIDRPSSKCLSFLRKHYNLHPCRWQANSFVIYDGFFGSIQAAGKKQDRHVGRSTPMDFQLPTSCAQQYHSHTGNVEFGSQNAVSVGVKSKSNGPHRSVSQQQQPCKNFNWSPQYVLNQMNTNGSNNQKHDFCSTNAPYLSMRQANAYSHGVPSQGLNYSRYSSSSSRYGSLQPRLPKPTLSTDFSQARYSRNLSSHKSFFK